MSDMTQQQLEVIACYGWDGYDMIEDGIAVCEHHHPNGVADVYVHPDGSVYVEEGDDLDGYEMVPLSDSFMSGILSDY